MFFFKFIFLNFKIVALNLMLLCLLMNVCVCVCVCVCVFVQVFSLTEQAVNIAFSVCFFGFFALPMIPACMELGVEVTYPVSEATSSGLLWSSTWVGFNYFSFSPNYPSLTHTYTTERLKVIYIYMLICC